jgi:hypothetical protein
MEEWNMDLKQLVLQRTRECFAERFGEIIAQVRQDRQSLRGWEEPAHLRAALRRAVDGAAEAAAATETALAEPDSFRQAGEPGPAEQREALGRTLEAGADALEKVSQSQKPDLTAEELVGLECLLLLYTRPSLLVCNGHLAAIPPFWKALDEQREAVEIAQRGVGRIELLGHPDYDWAGTGFLLNERCLLTTRRTAELFIENPSGTWQFRPGITAWLDFRSHACHPPSAGCRIHAVAPVSMPATIWPCWKWNRRRRTSVRSLWSPRPPRPHSWRAGPPTWSATPCAIAVVMTPHCSPGFFATLTISSACSRGCCAG